MEITKDILVKKHGDKADALFAEIALLGGFGDVGVGEGQLSPDCALDLRGFAENPAIDDTAKARIKAILADAPPAPKTETK